MIYDAEHFFDGWKTNRRLRRSDDPARRGRRPAPNRSCCATPTAAPCPRKSPQRRGASSSRCRVPVGIHCHNDCELAVANSLAAVDAGAMQVQGTINGFGERCGNADLISVVANLALKKQGYEVLVARRRRAADRAVALRLRNGQHELPPATSRSSARAPLPTRAACTSMRHSRAVGQLRAHRSRAGRQRAADAGQRAVRAARTSWP